MFKKSTLQQFVQDLSSSKPTPGGGSVAALTAANGAALAAMLCNLTAGKKGYEAYWEKMRLYATEFEVVSQDFLADIERDCQAFDGFMSALKMPKDDAKQAALRKEAMAKAVVVAAQTPLDVAKKAAALLDKVSWVVEHGNDAATSDGLIAGLLIADGVHAALCNVKINLPYISDCETKAQFEAETKKLADKAEQMRKEFLEKTRI